MGVELMDWEGWYWPNHFGDAVAEHNAIREHVGVWDESPLRKWYFQGPDALRQPTASSRTTCSGSRSARCATRPSATRTARWSATARSSSSPTTSCIGSPRSTPTSTTSRRSSTASQVEIEPITEKLPHLQIQGPKSRELLAGLTEAESSRISATSGSSRTRSTSAASRLGLAHRLLGRARLRGLLLPGLRRGALGGRHRCRREAVRPRCRRDDQDRVRADLHRLRLLPARDEPVRHVARQGDPARRADF